MRDHRLGLGWLSLVPGVDGLRNASGGELLVDESIEAVLGGRAADAEQGDSCRGCALRR
jgi:hypothetical protein